MADTQQPIRLVINITDGILNEIDSDVPVEILTVDYNQSMEEFSEEAIIEDDEGTRVVSQLSSNTREASPGRMDHYFNQRKRR